MQIIIDIPESVYKGICSDSEIMYSSMRCGKTLFDTLLRAVRNGTPLPKGHGRLIDADTVYDDFEKGEYDFEESLEFCANNIRIR